MLTQPRMMVCLVATDDIVRNYTTIRSIQSLNYRNFDAVCVVSKELQNIRRDIANDFNWLPIITSTNLNLHELVKMAVNRASSTFAESILFLMPGAKLSPDFVKNIIPNYQYHSKSNILIPALERPDSSTIYGAQKVGESPYDLKTIKSPLARIDYEEGTHPAGGAVLIHLKTCQNITIPNVKEESLMLLWTDAMITAGAKSVSLYKHTIFYDGLVYANLAKQSIIPINLYSDLKDYVTSHGKWYDKFTFWRNFTLKSEGFFNPRVSEQTAK